MTRRRRLLRTSPEIIGLFCVSVRSFYSLIAYELRRRQPLLEMRFFRSAPFSGARAIAVCTFAALGGSLFLITLYLSRMSGRCRRFTRASTCCRWRG